MNGHDDNDVGDMGYILVVSTLVSCVDGVLLLAQSSEKEGTPKIIVSRLWPGLSSEYKDSEIVITGRVQFWRQKGGMLEI